MIPFAGPAWDLAMAMFYVQVGLHFSGHPGSDPPVWSVRWEICRALLRLSVGIGSLFLGAQSLLESIDAFIRS